MKPIFYLFFTLSFFIFGFSQRNFNPKEVRYTYSKKDKIGLSSSDGKKILQKKYTELTFFPSINLALAKKNNQYRFIYFPSKKERILPYNHILPTPFDSLFIIENKTTDYKYGLINYTGEELLPPIYDNIKAINNNYLSILLNGKYGAVDSQGKVVIPAAYSDIQFKGDYFLVLLDNKYGIITPKGRVILPIVYSNIEINKNFFLVQLNDKYGVLNKKGKVIIPIQYDYISSFTPTLYKVSLNSLVGLITHEGKELTPAKYNSIEDYDESYALAYLKEEKGLISLENGTFKILNLEEDLLSIVKAPLNKSKFKGSFSSFLKKNLHYPSKALFLEIQGSVQVQFVVGKDGNITNIKIIGKKLGGGLEEEAIRVIKKSSGMWTPGTLNGKPVNSFFTQSITFSFQ